jgi:hypothetical protein
MRDKDKITKLRNAIRFRNNAKDKKPIVEDILDAETKEKIASMKEAIK